jgi:hypothetical protein
VIAYHGFAAARGAALLASGGTSKPVGRFLSFRLVPFDAFGLLGWQQRAGARCRLPGRALPRSLRAAGNSYDSYALRYELRAIARFRRSGRPVLCGCPSVPCASALRPVAAR